MRITLWAPKVRAGLAPQVVYDAVALVLSSIVPVDQGYMAILRWTRFERAIVFDWALREHAHASDNLTTRRRPRPWLVEVLEMDPPRKPKIGGG